LRPGPPLAEEADIKQASVTNLALRVVGGGLLLASGGIHLDLYITGYHSIPTIGPLFLLQVVSAFVLALAVLASGRWVVAASGAGFALSTLAGYSISRITPLFGFHEVRTTAGTVAGLIDVATIIVLGTAALSSLGASGKAFPPDKALRAALSTVSAVALIGFVVVDVAATATPRSSPQSASTAAPGAKTASGPELHVLIKNFAFNPATIDAQPGELIVVTNHDSVAHTLTAMPGSAPLGNFNTGLVQPGQTKDIDAPQKPGSYDYYCQIHNFMTGVIVVK
jgi:plastocyanin